MAACSFPANIGLGADNVAPRAIARLSSPAIQALIALFLCFEAAGDWCMAVNLVLIVLLPKPDGGRRPIGLFPTIIRIWMRARIWAAREWERLHDHDSLFAGPDMGAQKGIFAQKFTFAPAMRSWTRNAFLRPTVVLQQKNTLGVRPRPDAKMAEGM